jgi:hypothetical protein
MDLRLQDGPLHVKQIPDSAPAERRVSSSMIAGFHQRECQEKTLYPVRQGKIFFVTSGPAGSRGLAASLRPAPKPVQSGNAFADLCTEIGDIHKLTRILHLLPQFERVHTPIQLVTL